MYVLVLERATQNLKTRRALFLKTQTRPTSSSKKPEKLVLLEPKLEILEQRFKLKLQKLVLFELNTCSNSTFWNSMKLKLDKKWAQSSAIKIRYISGDFFWKLYPVRTGNRKKNQLAASLYLSPHISSYLFSAWMDLWCMLLGILLETSSFPSVGQNHIFSSPSTH